MDRSPGGRVGFIVILVGAIGSYRKPLPRRLENCRAFWFSISNCSARKPYKLPSVAAQARMHRSALCTWKLDRWCMAEILRPIDDSLLL